MAGTVLDTNTAANQTKTPAEQSWPRQAFGSGKEGTCVMNGCEMTVEANPGGSGSQEEWHGQGISTKAE